MGEEGEALTGGKVGPVWHLGNLLGAMETVRNETLFSGLQEYLPHFEGDRKIHENAHSVFPGQDDAVEHPHSFLFHPIHDEPYNPNSEVVGHVFGNLAWDFALRHLMPQNVRGLIVVGTNTCPGSDAQETFTYRVDGSDAFFMGRQDAHSPEYDQFKIPVDVDFHTNPLYPVTEGHCYYSLVSSNKTTCKPTVGGGLTHPI